MNALILLRDWQESQIEFWKPVEGFPGYDVSSVGRIKSWRERKGVPWGHPLAIGNRSRLLKPTRTQHHGYCTVYLYDANSRAAVKRKNGCQHRKQHMVHHLVAEAFLRNANALPEVNHRNGIKTDNRLDNLEWISTEANGEHARKTLGKYNKAGGHKLSFSIAKDVRTRVANGERYGEIAEFYGVRWRAIYDIASGKTYAGA